MAHTADCAICGIGTAGDDPAFYEMGYASRSELHVLRAKGAVGDVLGRFIEGEGRPILWTHAETSVSLSFDDLKRIPQVIGVAVGPSEVQPVFGTLRGGYHAHLITDADTVRKFLEIGDRVAIR